ncbi:sensor histidine kinase, partial [Marinitenerispora sediminis]
LDITLDNAVKYAGSGSTVTVSCGPGGAGQLLTVRDDGPGLAEAELAHATRRFWRSATAGQRGTGLGLAILQQLVAGRGGTLRLRRGAPRGMVVEIGLPAPEGGAPRVPAAEGPGPGGAR